MTSNNKRLTGILTTAGVLLLTPLVAMIFTSEVNWTAGDFVVAGVLLFGTGLLGEVVLRKVPKPRYRLALCMGLVTGLILVWVELAVGIFS